MVTDFELEPALLEHARLYVVVDVGLTVWLPVPGLEPDQPPEALQLTGDVALALIPHVKLALLPLVIVVAEAFNVKTGATGLGAGGGDGLGAGDGDGFGAGAGVVVDEWLGDDVDDPPELVLPGLAEESAGVEPLVLDWLGCAPNLWLEPVSAGCKPAIVWSTFDWRELSGVAAV